MRIVLGIDPGSEKSAYVLWDNKKILQKGIHPNEELLNILEDIWKWDLTEEIILAIEKIVSIHGKGGKAIIDTIHWTERFYQFWPGPKELVPVWVIKKALGAKNNAGVRRVLIQRFGEEFCKQLRGKGYHRYRAFAVAVVWMDHLQFQGRELK